MDSSDRWKRKRGNSIEGFLTLFDQDGELFGGQLFGKSVQVCASDKDFRFC